MDELEEGELAPCGLHSVGCGDGGAEGLMQRATLPVAASAAGVPLTGEEYLYMVRQERLRLPAVCTASPVPEVQKTMAELVAVDGGVAISDSVRPGDDWVEQMLAAFAGDRQAWAAQADGAEADDSAARLPRASDESAWELFVGQTEPGVAVLGRMEHAVRVRLLLFASRWVDRDGTLTDPVYRWAYCLLVSMEEGLGFDDMSILRTLARSCRRVLATSGASIDWNLVSNLNALLTIVARFYGQSDLLQRA